MMVQSQQDRLARKIARLQSRIYKPAGLSVAEFEHGDWMVNGLRRPVLAPATLLPEGTEVSAGRYVSDGKRLVPNDVYFEFLKAEAKKRNITLVMQEKIAVGFRYLAEFEA